MNENPQNLYRQAAAFHQKGQLAEAEALYQQLIAALPMTRTRHMLGILRLQQGRDGEALELLGAAVRISPRNPDMLGNYANAWGRWAAWMKRWRRWTGRWWSTRISPARCIIALFCFSNWAACRCLAAYDRLLAREPGVLEALFNRGILLLTLKRNSDALASFDRALAIKPDFAEVWHNRGNALRNLGRHDEALASFTKAWRSNRISPMRCSAVAVCYYTIWNALRRRWRIMCGRWRSGRFP